MTPEQIAEVRVTFGMTPRELARALGVAPVTIVRWESGSNSPTGLQLEVLRALHSSALTIKSDADKRALVAGLIGMGIGALIFWALTEGRRT